MLIPVASVSAYVSQ